MGQGKRDKGGTEPEAGGCAFLYGNADHNLGTGIFVLEENI
jgi:hypothetical protein